MPSVNLKPETYEKLKQLAERKGCSPDALADNVLEKEVSLRTMGRDEWLREFDKALAEVRAMVPAHLTTEEIEADADAAVARVRAARRAGGN